MQLLLFNIVVVNITDSYTMRNYVKILFFNKNIALYEIWK